jgi:hypothetical protein
MSPATTAGYSGTPLAKKLGFKPLVRVFVAGAPAHYRRWLEPLPTGVVFEKRAGATTDIAHVFVTDKEKLSSHLAALRRKLRPGAAIWVSWPKKSSGVPSTVTEDTVRALALPLGFVDVKVCAVNEIWSGLKLVVRKELR